MPWIKVSDDFMQHPKVLALSPRAIALWLEALCYVARHLTDGAIAPHVLAALRYRKAAPELRAAGLWEVTETGDQIHDYHDYQPAKDEIVNHRSDLASKRAEAGRRGAARRWQTAWQTDSNANGKTMAPSPTPTPKKDLTPKPPSAAPPEEGGADRFDAFWSAYPKKQAKEDARKAFKALRVDARLLELLLAALERQKHWPSWTKERGQFIPLPATWLRAKRWEDDPPDLVDIRAGPGYRSLEDWVCPHEPHCGSRNGCERLQALAAAREAS